VAEHGVSHLSGHHGFEGTGNTDKKKDKYNTDRDKG